MLKMYPITSTIRIIYIQKQRTPTKALDALKTLYLCGFFDYLKYLPSSPSNALPWRASSRAIS